MGNPMRPAPSAPRRTQSEFSTAFVVQALRDQGLLSPAQAQDLLSKEQQARQRVLKAQGNGKDAARYQVSPVEIVAAFQIPMPGARGVLDQDRISEAVARAAGVPYRK